MSAQFHFDGTKARLEPSVVLQSQVFQTDPMVRYMLSKRNPDKLAALTPRLMRTLLTSAALNGAYFDEAFTTAKLNEHQAPECSAIWMPPGHAIDSPMTYLPAGFVGLVLRLGLPGLARLLGYQWRVGKLKKRTLGKQAYIYLFIIGTAQEARGQGLSSQIIKHQQEKAQAQGLPIWLEASSAQSHALYLKLGFQDVEPVTVGKGAVNADGLVEKGGQGVTFFTMVWRPEGAA